MVVTAGKRLVNGLLGRTETPQRPEPADGLEAGRMIRTWSGAYIDVFDPHPNDILIEDIAHGLAMRCRFGGHTKSYHSVAEHCIFMCDMVPQHLKMQALLHDASEAYIGDMPTPIKKLMPDYLRLEAVLMERIGLKFGFDPHHLDPQVKALDRASLEFEWEHKVLDDTMDSLPIDRVKALFIERYEWICKHN